MELDSLSLSLSLSPLPLIIVEDNEVSQAFLYPFEKTVHVLHYPA
jgi:hypothetical protein